MGLINKEIEVKLTSSNMKHYELLGYELPKRKDKWGNISIPKNSIIKVRINDLPNGSHTKIEVKCDGENCDKILTIEYRQYIKNNYNGQYFCDKCSMNYAIKNNIKTRLKKTKSFEIWCIENNRQDILNRWDYELNNCKPSEITYGTKNKYYFKCDKHFNHKSELKNIGDFTNGHNGVMDCKQCNSIAQWGIDNICEDFLDKYWDYNKNTLNPWDVSRYSTKKIWIKCQEREYHGSYEIICSNFTCGNSRCSYCSSKKIHPKDSLGQYIIDRYGQCFLNKIWSDKNKKTPFEYGLYSRKEVWWKCFNNKHSDFKKRISESTTHDFRCPECSKEKNESILQEKVRLYINSLNYTILHEEKCTVVPRNPKTNRYLPFDNEIKELKLIIEINGMQHYSITNFHNLSAKHYNTTPQYELHYQKVKDRYKRIIAKQKGYYFLEIPYWTDNKSEEWKQLIDNKINEILHNQSKQAS